MFTTEWKAEEDGSFIESLLSLKEGTGFIFKLRVVRGGDGRFHAVVRDYQTGEMLACRTHSDHVVAQMIVIELAYTLLGIEYLNVCSKIQKLNCPFKDTKDYCKVCGIPETISSFY